MLAEVSTSEIGPFRFLSLPFELRRQIIRFTVSNTCAVPKPPDGYRSGFEIEPHDFVLSTAGLRCRFLTSFSFALVNRQIRQEALSVIFQNSTVCLHVEIPKHGPLSGVFASMPRILHTLDVYPLLLGLAREVTVIFDAEPGDFLNLLPTVQDGLFQSLKNSALFLLAGLCVSVPIAIACCLAGWVHRTGPFRGKRHSDLQALVDTVARRSRSHKHVKIILYLEHLTLEDLKIILGLFETPCCPITLEEWWTQWLYPVRKDRVKENYQKRYKNLVSTAAEAAGHKWLLTVCPSTDEFEMDETDDRDVGGPKVIGKRRRVWL